MGGVNGQSWWTVACQVVDELAARAVTFTTDDVWALLAERTEEQPGDRRLLGRVIRNAAEAKRIAHTGRFQPSERAECHHRPVAVWRGVPEGRTLRETMVDVIVAVFAGDDEVCLSDAEIADRAGLDRTTAARYRLHAERAGLIRRAGKVDTPSGRVFTFRLA